MWNFLGLSYHELGDRKKAIKAFENAVKLDPHSAPVRINAAYSYLLNKDEKKARSSAEAAIQLDPTIAAPYYFLGSLAYRKADYAGAEVYVEKAIALQPNYAPAHTLDADIALARLGLAYASDRNMRTHIHFLQRAVTSLESAHAHSLGLKGRESLAEYLAGIKTFHDTYSKPRAQPDVDLNAQVVPYKITSKQPATYTDAARTAGVEGIVRLIVVLDKSGKIGPILPVIKLPNGLTESAIRAARNIRFTPKIVNGEPVSVTVTIEYGFNIF